MPETVWPLGPASNEFTNIIIYNFNWLKIPIGYKIHTTSS